MINIPSQERLVKKYGTAQYNIAMEESAELIQAVNKHIRYDNIESREHLIEEVADVLICIEQLKLLADIKESEIQNLIDYKCDRTRRRLMEDAEWN